MEVWVEMTQTMFSDEVKRIEDLERSIRKRIEDTLGLSVQVKLVEPKSIERSQGKAKRVIDKRRM
jgi:phenylacetate-CoA ligase